MIWPFAARDELLACAARYAILPAERALIERYEAVWRRNQGPCLTKDDLFATVDWKSSLGQTRKLCNLNSEDDIRQITRAALTADCERLRIGVLLALDGVAWPIASVILHFAFAYDANGFPVFDKRAMKAVGSDTKYSNGRWTFRMQRNKPKLPTWLKVIFWQICPTKSAPR